MNNILTIHFNSLPKFSPTSRFESRNLEMAAANNSSDLLHDFFPLIRVHKDGRIERLEVDQFVPPSPDHPNSESGVRTKDVVISPEFNVSARIYLPTIVPGEKIPLLVYFHGGGFVIGSTFTATYQNHLHALAKEAKVLIVSVDYRLAPENPLPAAYEDSWNALKWIAGDRFPEEWIRDHADLGRVYFGGDSAGGNIAHNMALKIGVEGINGLKLEGMFLNCPYFWGKDPIGNEAVRAGEKKYLDSLWPFVYPGSSGLDDPYMNPVKNPDLALIGCRKVVVFVGGLDVLKDRGWLYKAALEKSGWGGGVEVVEVEGEGHVFCLFSHNSEKTIAMIKKLSCFLNGLDFHG